MSWSGEGVAVAIRPDADVLITLLCSAVVPFCKYFANINVTHHQIELAKGCERDGQL